jgi:hypothetical protein
MFIIYAIAINYKREIARYWNGRAAFDACHAFDWQWTDPETGFVYDLEIEDEED